MNVNLSLNFAWWWVPIALVLAGFAVGSWRARHYRGGYLDMSGLVFVFWFCLFCAAAVGVVGAKVLLS